MIKKLQRKFVFIAIGSLTLVIVVLIGTVNLINLYQMDQRAKGLLTILAENSGRFPEFKKDGHPKHMQEMTPETQFETRYFLVWTDQNEIITQIDTGHIAAVSSSDAQTYAEIVLEKNKQSGYEAVYKYFVKTYETGEKLMIFIDCSSQLRSVANFFISSCSIALLCIFIVFVLVSIFSKRAIRPVLESMEKQKRFITDAGHEIKTPLAIISANTEVIELTEGESEWTKSTKNQVVRLNNLIKHLLTLSKLEEDSGNFIVREFSLSDLVQEAANSFAALAQNQKKQLQLAVEPQLRFQGDKESIHELVSILVDNAVKYASDGGVIRVSLEKKKKWLLLEVYNDCEIVPEGDLNRLFERFYRADDSRARETGGYGIGLSIAKAIVQNHRAKIIVKREEKGICFQVQLKRKEN